MNELVFMDPDCITEEPFTTSKVIAENINVKHHAIQQLILKYEDDIKDFGKLAFEMRPSEKGQPEKIYHLNEQQATLIITFTRNNDIVVRFKKALVKQFYLMAKELKKRAVTREIGKQAREYLTNAIQGLPDSPHKQMKYKHYTDLAYTVVLGKNAKQLKIDHGIIKKEQLRDYFSSEKLDQLAAVERQIASMVELGYEYKIIKEVIQKKYLMIA